MHTSAAAWHAHPVYLSKSAVHELLRMYTQSFPCACVGRLVCHRFADYAGLVQDQLMPGYGATWHWAKIEPPADPARLAAMKAALAARFPLEQFNAYRARFDPENILGNRLLDQLLGTPHTPPTEA